MNSFIKIGVIVQQPHALVPALAVCIELQGVHIPVGGQLVAVQESPQREHGGQDEGRARRGRVLEETHQPAEEQGTEAFRL